MSSTAAAEKLGRTAHNLLLTGTPAVRSSERRPNVNTAYLVTVWTFEASTQCRSAT